MEFKMYVIPMIVLIPLFGIVSGHSIGFPEDVCPEFTKQYCACNGTIKPKTVPIRMCLYGEDCKACPMELQDHLDCSMCPGNTCPVCSENESSLRAMAKNESADVKTFFARSARKSRDAAWDPLPHDLWCEFNRNMLNGQIECTFTTYSKECLLSCYEPYSVNGQKELAFACKRKENVWKPEIQPCVDNSRVYDAPEIPKEPEEPQQPQLPKAPAPKTKSENSGNNDFHLGDERGAGAGAAPEDDEDTYESDDDGVDQVVQSGKENPATSRASSSVLPDDKDTDEINEGAMKDFYDILNSK